MHNGDREMYRDEWLDIHPLSEIGHIFARLTGLVNFTINNRWSIGPYRRHKLYGASGCDSYLVMSEKDHLRQGHMECAS